MFSTVKEVKARICLVIFHIPYQIFSTITMNGSLFRICIFEFLTNISFLIFASQLAKFNVPNV